MRGSEFFFSLKTLFFGGGTTFFFREGDPFFLDNQKRNLQLDQHFFYGEFNFCFVLFCWFKENVGGGQKKILVGAKKKEEKQLGGVFRGV